MSATRLEQEPGGPLSRGEIEALHARVAPQSDLGDAATVRAVAEASGMTEEDVAAHLRRIRAETAFVEPKEARPSALPWVAGAALVVGLGVTWWRLHPDDPVASLLPAIPPPAVSTTVRSVATSPLVGMVNMDGPKAPPGLRVEAIGQRSDREGDGEFGEVRALSYEEVRDGLAASGEAVVGAAHAADGDDLAPSGTRYHGMDGGIFSPRPGYVRLSMSGWAGSEAAWIAVPVADASRAAIRSLAERLLKDAKETQEAALAPVADPKSGLVGPPPGFAVRFAGRRLDVQRGPRVSFAPIPIEALARRLEAAILNAAFRDRRPPVGPWSGDAAADARIPQPDASRVEIMGRGGETFVGDVPTGPGGDAATAKAARELAARATGSSGGGVGADGKPVR